MRIDIRAATSADADAIAQVHVTSWNESYHGLLPDELIESRTLDARRRQWHGLLGRDDRVTMLADAEGDTLGFASALVLEPPVDGFCAYLQTLYLLSSAKRQGVGSALLGAVATSLSQRKCRKLALRVVRENLAARAFYERLGARLVPDGITVDAGIFDDVVYAFDDLAALSDRLGARVP